ncbi:thioesterase family protein [Calothrix sp. UHCC 0171]|uniref:acyl-CoA thioesterase n=1 Tax=Calothrix sp. UHCC 0171 TaxID=3110245 RepID=UPI002B1ED73B|nr:thioesterase family protein [Calothrix sp. UHCC 0171]MEA5571397.1 thioesterase family protein [Calothrix sp. UHCC 0171]
MTFTYHRTIRFQDTDAAGVVYFANILKICHEAYEESLEASGINLQNFFQKSVIAYPIVHANVDFWKPIFCGDKLVVNLTSEKLNGEKFAINYKIAIADSLVSQAMTRHVCIDVASRQKRELPDAINQWLQSTMTS